MAYVYTDAGTAVVERVSSGEWLVLRAIDAVVAIVEVLLAMRLVLVFLGANTGNAFMQWLLGTTGSLVAPFANIFASWNIGGFVFEWTTVFAMIVYGLIGWVLMRVVAFILSAARGA